MVRKAPAEPAKNFNLNIIKKGADKKTEYITSKRKTGVKYWKKLSKEEKKCKKDFEEKKSINLAEYKNGKYISNSQALAVTYSQVFKKESNCKKYIGKDTKKTINKTVKKSKKKICKKVKLIYKFY